jgi:hypothetical protein
MTRPDTIVDDEKIQRNDAGADEMMNENREYVLREESGVVLNDSNDSSNSEMDVDADDN